MRGQYKLALAVGFVVAGAPCIGAAQTQIKPRVILMVDTSGSMVEHFNDDNLTGGDGTFSYDSHVMSRSVGNDGNLALWVGNELGTPLQCNPTSASKLASAYDGSNSREAAAKAAVTNVVNGSGDVEWGLERYFTTQCPIITPVFTPAAAMPEPPGRCQRGGDCASGTCNANGVCTCSSAGQCPNTQACTGNVCVAAAGLCGTFGRTGGVCTCNNDNQCGQGKCSAVNGTNICVCPNGGAPNASGMCTCADHGDCGNANVCGTSNQCGTWNDFTPQTCTSNSCGPSGGATCAGGASSGSATKSGKCGCTTDNDCASTNIGFGLTDARFCIGSGTNKVCGNDLNLCGGSGLGAFFMSLTDARSGSCVAADSGIPLDSGGTCGTPGNANDGFCNTTRVCYADSDCDNTAGSCLFFAGEPYGECQCGAGGGNHTCPAGINTGGGAAPTVYTCTGSRCVYNQKCQDAGGTILVDPASAGYSSLKILPYVDGIDDLVNGNPELHADAYTPLAGAARSVIAWYNAIKTESATASCKAGTDASPLCDRQITCRPYALVQITDGADECDDNASMPGGASDTQKDNGPINAASGFVDATVANARVPNKVYVIGLAADADLQTVANAMAREGGTLNARFANNQSQIEEALADIVASSVLVEKCNYIDDDCNGVCDDSFPDVSITGTSCSNDHAAHACNNGAVGHCAAAGLFKCSTDHLSEACGPGTCRTGSGTGLVRNAGPPVTVTLNGVSGFVNSAFPTGDIGSQITIVGARIAANNGTFTITAATGTSVTFNNTAGATEADPTGYEVYCASQLACRQGAGTTLTVTGGKNVTLTGASGFLLTDVNLSITISGANNSANLGTFPITTVNSPAPNTVTFTNTLAVAESGPNPVTYSINCHSPSCRFGGSANLGNKNAGAGTIDLTGVTGFSQSDVVPANPVLITIRSAGNPLNVGNFAITAVNAAGTTVTIKNPNGVVDNTNVVTWNIYCANAESLGGCNNFDDDCNGVIDDCQVGVAGSCCVSTGCLPVEICNGIDDDCNGLTDDNPVDVGGACGNNVGDCSPGVLACCTGDPTMGGNCVNAQASTDQPFCINGNPGYPKPADLCDGTDDNCDGTTNGVPPNPCYVDPTATMNPFNPALAGVGLCRAGSQPCTTSALPSPGPSFPCPSPFSPGQCGACPAGGPSPWPAFLPCPNPTHTFGACTGAAGPHVETCNGEDDDCDGTPDDNVTDPWVGMPCCPTGNLADCTNTGTGTRCMKGTYQCVMGGQQCVGGVAKSPEICDGIDNDCNGLTDDVPGLNSTCTANGVNNQGSCKAVFICVVGSPGMCDGAPCPNGLTCNQVGTPGVEVCNGVDDDCDGIVDNPNEVMMNDPALQMPCDVPTPPNDKPPCMAGTPVCLNGKVECTGAVTPMTNVCGQAATDCTGNPSNNCPPGSMCFQGNCVTPCSNGEFPCQGGFVCDQSQTPPLCIPNACAKMSCPTGQNCQIASDGTASCVDPCAGINCGTGFACLDGACVDNSCRTFGCPDGQLCTGTPPACVPNPCFGVQCDAGDYCADGNCVPLCTTCLKGETCVNGMCQGDPCSGVKCPNGQICADTSGVGSCVTNTCLSSTCGLDQVCCGGGCVSNPCDLVVCPAGINCEIDVDCNAKCSSVPQAPADKIVGAGGGGFACDVGAGHDSEGALWLVLLMLAALVARRRRSVARAGEVR